MTPEYAGKYERFYEENFESLLSELGIGFILRKVAVFSTPTMEIRGKDDTWTIMFANLIKSIRMDFTFGVPFQETTVDGRTCKTVVRREGTARWITEQKSLKPGQKDLTVVRDFDKDEVKVTTTVGEVSSLQKFRRISS